MDPITWTVVAGLLVKYGPEVADFIIRKVHAGDVVTLEEWDNLQALANNTSQIQLTDGIERNAIDANSDDVKALESMIKKT